MDFHTINIGNMPVSPAREGERALPGTEELGEEVIEKSKAVISRDLYKEVNLKANFYEKATHGWNLSLSSRKGTLVPFQTFEGDYPIYKHAVNVHRLAREWKFWTPFSSKKVSVANDFSAGAAIGNAIGEKLVSLTAGSIGVLTTLIHRAAVNATDSKSIIKSNMLVVGLILATLALVSIANMAVGLVAGSIRLLLASVTGIIVTIPVISLLALPIMRGLSSHAGERDNGQEGVVSGEQDETRSDSPESIYSVTCDDMPDDASPTGFDSDSEEQGNAWWQS